MMRQLRAEWTKFRTVRGWVIGMALAGGFIIAFGLFPGMQGTCTDNKCKLPTGPEGHLVTDRFEFAGQTLDGDGSLTVNVTSMTGELPPGPHAEQPRQGVTPWAKAGLIIKDGTKAGSPYAAIMLTGSHGVRLQHNYLYDQAGAGAASWLRLTRSGDAITGEQSADGTHWTKVGTVVLKGLPTKVQAGLFATSPQHSEASALLSSSGPSSVTATFRQVSQQGSWSGRLEETELTGSGDIGTLVSGSSGLGVSITQALAGTFLGLVFAIVIGTTYVTSEYRRGLMRTTFSATPRRGRVLAAKAIVAGGATFVTGLIAATVAVVFGQEMLRDNGVFVHPVPTATEVRVIVGTAALLALCAVLGVAIGVLLRRSALAVTLGVTGIVLPYILAMSVLPDGAGRWLLSVSPAAAFAIQQTAVEYAHVANNYIPTEGFFPLSPWLGFTVLAGWTAVAVGLAAIVTHRRDA